MQAAAEPPQGGDGYGRDGLPGEIRRRPAIPKVCPPRAFDEGKGGSLAAVSLGSVPSSHYARTSLFYFARNTAVARDDSNPIAARLTDGPGQGSSRAFCWRLGNLDCGGDLRADLFLSLLDF